MSVPRSKRLQQENGTAYVETAMLFPLLVLLIFAPINLNTWYERYSALSSASAQVARLGAALPVLARCDANCASAAGHGQLVARAQEILTTAGFDTSEMEISTALKPTDPNDKASPTVVEVSVSLPFAPIGIEFVTLPSIASSSRVARFQT